ncbi:MAG: hypothetical protein JRI23_06205 [Deltaproteobacteria bacterium]|jgi:hypothetical protein|nr:hypothetical protein [Deltaproteobacteria bacterium]MBW2531167.1 hypothetical protein [Deltaproteobacteria bacterium]
MRQHLCSWLVSDVGGPIRRLARNAVVAVLALLLVHCGPAEESGEPAAQVFWNPDPATAGRPAVPGVAAAWLGTDPAGSLVWFGGRDGRVLARASAPGSAGQAVDEIAVGERDHRVVVLERPLDAPEGAGRVVSYRLAHGPPGLDAPQLIGEVGAPARLVSLPVGVAVFEGMPVPTWGVLPREGWEGSKQPWPPPVALWHHPDRSNFEAAVLLQVAGRVRHRWLRVRATSQGFELVGETPLAPSWSAARGVPRVAPHPRGVVAAAVEGDHLLLSVQAAVGGVVAHHRLDVGRARLAAFTRLPLTPRSDESYAVLLSQPTRLLVVRLDGGLRAASVLLPGDLRAEGRQLQRLLVSWGSRIWVATTEGVFAIDLLDEGNRLTVDSSFDGRSLRGPLAGPAFER